MNDNLKYAINFMPEEIEARKMLTDWMPKKLIDAHSHCGLYVHSENINPELKQQAFSTFLEFTLDESESIQALLYPNKKIVTLRFPFPFKGVDFKKANAYLLNNLRKNSAVVACGIPWDIDYTSSVIHDSRVIGLKMYPFQFFPPAKRILQYFRPEILEEAQVAGIPIILHLPSVITESQDELAKIVIDFPRLTIILAHLGLPNIPVVGLADAYKRFLKNDNVYFDTALVVCEPVLDLAFKTFGAQRIIFGSDAPMNLVRANIYKHPQYGERLITERAYHWVDSKEHAEYGHLGHGAIHMHWKAMYALRKTIEALPKKIRSNAKEFIFWKNSKNIFHL